MCRELRTVSIHSVSLDLQCYLPVDKLFDIARPQLPMTASDMGNKVVLSTEKVKPTRLVATWILTLPPNVETTFMYDF